MAVKTFVEDIRVVWEAGTAPAHELPESFSWGHNEEYTLFTRLPMIRVTPDRMSDIESGTVKISDEISDIIFESGVYVSTSGMRKRTEYTAIYTDLHRLIVVQSTKSGLILKKSRVDSQSEYRVIMQAQGARLRTFDWTPEDSVTGRMGNDTFLTEKDFVGLTRRERMMKDMLIDALINLNTSVDGLAEFWYGELFPKLPIPEGASAADLRNRMIDEIQSGWSKRHEDFGTSYIRAYDLDYKRWKKLLNVDLDFVVSFPEVAL
ncbi:hypothetical protein BSP36_036 [Bacillus phage BSP36]|nr:hypothetical protein BSP36_036 [Bacillus phage BSP36]